jgi:hypothetical protein
VPHDSDLRGVKFSLRVPRCAIQQLIEEKTYIRYTARDQSFPTRQLFRFGLAALSRQFRCDDLGVIQCRHHIPVAAQVRTQKRGRTPVAAAVMRVNDQWISSGLRCGVADGGLTLRRVACRSGEGILCARRNILTRMLRRRRIPNLASELTVAPRVERLNAAHTDRKSPPDKWIVHARSRCRLLRGILFRMRGVFAGHQEQLLFGSYEIDSLDYCAETL